MLDGNKMSEQEKKLRIKHSLLEEKNYALGAQLEAVKKGVINTLNEINKIKGAIPMEDIAKEMNKVENRKESKELENMEVIKN